MTTEIWAIGLAFLSALIGAFGPIYIKKGMNNFSLKINKLLRNYEIIGGALAYLAGIIIFMFALKGGELSMLYPLVATTYIWVSFLSIKMLGEKMNRKKWLGISIIIFGVVLISMGA